MRHGRSGWAFTIKVLTEKLFGPRDGITGPNGFLPRDPGRLLTDSWAEHARLWFEEN
jgi:hypothetical protein